MPMRDRRAAPAPRPPPLWPSRGERQESAERGDIWSDASLIKLRIWQYPAIRRETMQETIARIRKFRDDRDWKQFHDPKNLAVSISVEAAELLEIFQWMTGEQAAQHAAQNKERVSDEIADVAIYLIELADIVGIDLAAAIDAK